ncbi:MAG TPA: hypothetical protein VFJ58_06235 [Armatimonadota bacterium]|nr:hypothetical protein [Armatimonadota bacterium]
MSQEYNEPGGIGARLGGALKRSVGGVFNQARSAKVRMEITSLNGRKQDQFAEIGKKVYTLYESGLVRNADLLSLCSQVRQIDLEIAAKEEDLAAIRPDEDSERSMPPAPYEGGIEDAPDPDGV